MSAYVMNIYVNIVQKYINIDNPVGNMKKLVIIIYKI
jgi:hypothetical protein